MLGADVPAARPIFPRSWTFALAGAMANVQDRRNQAAVEGEHIRRLLRAELVQVSPGDPLALLGASAALIVSVVLGCVIPARRAARVDPLVALRYE